jgi:hypothetical protein
MPYGALDRSNGSNPFGREVEKLDAITASLSLTPNNLGVNKTHSGLEPAEHMRKSQAEKWLRGQSYAQGAMNRTLHNLPYGLSRRDKLKSRPLIEADLIRRKGK